MALTLALLFATPAAAIPTRGPTQAEICLHAADTAADRAGIPRSVMRAITLTETGRSRDGRFEPWPWTVNMEGKGRWFDTPQAALRYVKQEQARGARSFDVGCFQVNHLWHGQHFASLEAMFDPATNAAYAARFLSELHDETGDWSRAAGFYHSRTPEFFNRYRERFDRLHARVARDLGQPVPAKGERRAPTAQQLTVAAPAPASKTVTPRIVPVDTATPRTVAHSAGGVAIRVIAGHVSPRETRGRSFMLTAARGPLATGAARPLVGN